MKFLRPKDYNLKQEIPTLENTLIGNIPRPRKHSTKPPASRELAPILGGK